MQKKLLGAGLLFAVILFLSSLGHAFTDQTTSERILGENKSFLNFINVCVTNFAADKKDEFKQIYQQHFNADVAYLQADYKRTYKRVYACQDELSRLYETMLKDYYLEDSKEILDTLAPDIIRSKNARARLFLTLGYRDRTVSWTHYTVGNASNPKLHSYRIFKYEEGIKMARRAKRYGFLALFESQDPENKRNIYNRMLKNEVEKGNLFYNRFLGLTEEEFFKHLNMTYEAYEESLKQKKEAETEGEEAQPKTFEKQVEKRVRFRNEARAARFLMNTEFDKAEDILRDYVDDFNFKLISATFDVLSDGSEKKENGGGEAAPRAGGKPDYSSYKVHLIDNYSRLSQDSVMEGFLGDLKVVDDISEKPEEGDATGKDESGEDETDDDTGEEKTENDEEE